MKIIKIRNMFLLFITAIIWGVAFVAQRTGGDLTGPFTFNGIRSVIGGIVLLPVVYIMGKKRKSKVQPADDDEKNIKEKRKLSVKAGVICGILLAVSTSFQQVGIFCGTTAGKAGFLTACYIVIVPVLGLFLKKKCGANIWMAVALALTGLYLLCINGKFILESGDILIIICAVCFAMHILTVDYFSPKADGVRMSCIQFFVCGVICMTIGFFTEMDGNFEGVKNSLSLLNKVEPWIPILYAGVLSSGVGYTLQIIGQKGLNPTIASLIMSLESVFSVIAGFVFLGEVLTKRELAGCTLLFIAIIIAQIPFHFKKKAVCKEKKNTDIFST